MGTVKLKYVYNGMGREDVFNVVENGKRKTILLSNNVVKKIQQKIKCIPVECKIETGNSPVVSWNRPIRSLKYKEDFEELLKDLEERGVIENSTSTWLNPVVLTRKKKWQT
jgi:hypothetical protein